MKEICNSKLCTGCYSCASSCPKQCIVMKPDSEGFYRPMIDETKCVNCRLCEEKCPINKEYVDDKITPLTFAAQNTSDDIRLSASSGGVFPLLAMKIIEDGGVVFGAGLDGNLQVVHKPAFDINDLKNLYGSKYVQSRIGTTYIEIKHLLQKGKKVYFSGTPCQVGGLYSYLGKDYPNLFTQDIICHGVPSPKMWNKYLEYHRMQQNSKPISASFRDKKYGWKYYSMQIGFQNGGTYINKNINDYYLRAFIMNMGLRQSCEECQFKQIHRMADITLADFWDINDVLPDWNDDKGTSLIMIHSEKGKALFDAASTNAVIKPVDFHQGTKNNPSMTCSVKHNPLRKRFLKDLDRISFDRLYARYCGDSYASKMIRRGAWIIGRIERIIYEK